MSNAGYTIMLVVMSVAIVALLLGMVYLISKASSVTRESTRGSAPAEAASSRHGKHDDRQR